jgi:hypothetical protein
VAFWIFILTCFNMIIVATAAYEMTDLPASANGDKAEQNESKTIRHKACTHLKELVDDVREAGKYLFRRNPNRTEGMKISTGRNSTETVLMGCLL